MSLSLINEIWKTLKPSIQSGAGTDELADILVDLLINEGFMVEDINDAFEHDREVREVLGFYLENPEDSHHFDEEEDDEDEYEETYSLYPDEDEY